MLSASPNRNVRIGPAGWSYPDWRGIVYPARKPTAFQEVEYLSHFFDTIEINTSFYNPPRPEVVKSWLRQVQHNQNFKFTAKFWQRFTHERSADLEDERLFKEGIAPLAEAGRLGALLIQFPWSFKNTPENRQYVARLCVRFKEFPLVIEVRHLSWNAPEILEFLQELGVGFCNIDQPVIGLSLGPTERTTSPIGYVRLHGRNYKEWFSSDAEPAERYSYLYSLEELEPWIQRINGVAQHTRAVFVITNNHFRGQAVTNALELNALMTNKKVQAPESLIRQYPELVQFAISESPLPPNGQIGLPFSEPPPKS
jgi:uncharacterized protein YecE (DUF72 family)